MVALKVSLVALAPALQKILITSPTVSGRDLLADFTLLLSPSNPSGGLTIEPRTSRLLLISDD
jgi:hypothetical protein